MSSLGSPEDVEALVLELKNTSELMVDLGLSSLLYDAEELAEEVRLLEDHVDEVYSKVQLKALQAARDDLITIDQAMAVARLAEATERIADAAREIADVSLRDVETHPVLAASVAESDVVFLRSVVRPEAELAGKALRETQVQAETGMHIFAVRRQGRWFLGPTGEDVLEAGDVVLASGPEDGRAKLWALCGATEEDDEDEDGEA